MHRGDNGYIGAKIAVIADDDFPVILNRKVEIGKKVFTNFGVDAIVELNGSLDAGALSKLANELRKDLFPFLVLVLKGGVILGVQVVGFQFYGF